MFRKLFIILVPVLLTNSTGNAMDGAEIGRRQGAVAGVAQPQVALPVRPITVQDRVAAFNEWKKDPKIAQQLNSNESGTVQAYIHLSMIMQEPEEKVKSPASIAHATQFAQAVCPSYTFWPEFYQVYSCIQHGKSYTCEEQTELILAPTMAEILRLKMMAAALKGEGHSQNIRKELAFGLKPDWKIEMESAGIKEKDSKRLMDLIPRLLPPKREEVVRLKQEIEQLSKSEALREMMTRKNNEVERTKREIEESQLQFKNVQAALDAKVVQSQQDAQALAQLQKSRQESEQQIQGLNESLKNDQKALLLKRQELELVKLREEETREQLKVELQKQIQTLQEATDIKNELEVLKAKEKLLLQEADTVKAKAAGSKQAYEQLKEKQNRVATSLALFESSKTNGWEAAFVQTLKTELEK